MKPNIFQIIISAVFAILVGALLTSILYPHIIQTKIALIAIGVFTAFGVILAMLIYISNWIVSVPLGLGSSLIGFGAAIPQFKLLVRMPGEHRPIVEYLATTSDSVSIATLWFGFGFVVIAIIIGVIMKLTETEAPLPPPWWEFFVFWK